MMFEILCTLSLEKKSWYLIQNRHAVNFTAGHKKMATFVLANFINPCNYQQWWKYTSYMYTNVHKWNKTLTAILIIWKKDHADAGIFARSSVSSLG